MSKSQNTHFAESFAAKRWYPFVYATPEQTDSLAQWLEHAIADRRVACSNHAGVFYEPAQCFPPTPHLFFLSHNMAIKSPTV